MICVVEMNEWGCWLYSGAGNLLTFVSFCDKNTGPQVICGAGFSPEKTVTSITTLLAKTKWKIEINNDRSRYLLS